MSFSKSLKREIANIIPDLDSQRAEIYGLIRTIGDVVLTKKQTKIIFKTKINAVARVIIKMLGNCYQISPSIYLREEKRLDKNPTYLVEVEDGLFILQDLELYDKQSGRIREINYNLLSNQETKSSFVRGTFLGRGSINNPKSNNYHLEIVSDLHTVESIKLVIGEVYIKSQIIERKKGFVLYVKKSEQIGDFLKFIGSIANLLEFENIRIGKDITNYVNRYNNCDIANAEKSLRAAKKQLEDIELIKQTEGLKTLTPRLKDAITLRVNYPEDSLQELSNNSFDTIGRYISKSGLSHCFRDIKQIADKIRNSKKWQKELE